MRVLVGFNDLTDPVAAADLAAAVGPAYTCRKGLKELRDVAGEFGKNRLGGNGFAGGEVLRVGQ